MPFLMDPSDRAMQCNRALNQKLSVAQANLNAMIARAQQAEARLDQAMLDLKRERATALMRQASLAGMSRQRDLLISKVCAAGTVSRDKLNRELTQEGTRAYDQVMKHHKVRRDTSSTNGGYRLPNGQRLPAVTKIVQLASEG